MAQTRTDNGNMYRAKGWLGIITAGKLWIDFKGEDQMEYRVIQLLTECCNRLSKTGNQWCMQGFACLILHDRAWHAQFGG